MSKSWNIKKQSLNWAFDFGILICVDVYSERNVAALRTKNYRCVLFSRTMNILAHITS